MANACVGCGLTVIGGKLTIQGAAPGEQSDVGIVCVDGEGVDYVVPMLVRRAPSGGYVDASEELDGLYFASVPMDEWKTTYNTMTGIMSVDTDGSLVATVGGVYSIHMTSGGLLAEDSTHNILGGRSRVARDGLFIASDGQVIYEPADGNMASESADDGPEWSCSAVTPLDAGDVLTYEALIQTSVVSQSITFPREINVLSVVRLGSTRT